MLFYNCPHIKKSYLCYSIVLKNGFSEFQLSSAKMPINIAFFIIQRCVSVRKGTNK